MGIEMQIVYLPVKKIILSSNIGMIFLFHYVTNVVNVISYLIIIEKINTLS